METLDYRSVSPTLMVPRLAVKLKQAEGMAPPSWAGFAKTAPFKRSLPESMDWWYVRAASVLLNLSKKSGTGVSRLSAQYGGRKVGTSKPHHVQRGSRKLIRTLIDQLEAAGFITISQGKKQVTPKAEALLSQVAAEVVEEQKEREPTLALYAWRLNGERIGGG